MGLDDGSKGNSMRTLVSKILVVAVATAGFSSVAFAHGGDHSHMGFVELVTHLSASLDHKSTIIAVGAVFAVIAIAAVVRGRTRAR